jgi:hypothetical protein
MVWQDLAWPELKLYAVDCGSDTHTNDMLNRLNKSSHDTAASYASSGYVCVRWCLGRNWSEAGSL